MLSRAAELLPESDYVVSVCSLDACELRKNWSEWMVWFESLIRHSSDYGLEVSECGELLDKQFSLEKIYPYYSAAGGDGYGESFVSSKNSWMIRYVRKASERMIDLADRFPNDTGLKTRLLNLGAKELLLAQSVNLSKMIENEEFADDIVEDYRNDGDQHLCYDIIHVYAFNAQVQQKVLYQQGEKSAAVE